MRQNVIFWAFKPDKVRGKESGTFFVSKIISKWDIPNTLQKDTLTSKYSNNNATWWYFCRPHHRPWKVPFSWASVTQWATWAPSLRETCWCRTSTWWRASSSPGLHYRETKIKTYMYSSSLMDQWRIRGNTVWIVIECGDCLIASCSVMFFCVPVKAAILRRLTTSQTSASKLTPPWLSATSGNCLASGQTTTWWDFGLSFAACTSL